MSLLIKNAKAVITCDKKFRVLKDASILIEDGRITEISRKPKPANEKIDAKNKLVMPGLINAHTHLPMTLLRGIADDLPLMRWLQEYIWPVEAKMNKGHIKAGAFLGIAEMIKTGTTCFNDMYWHEDAVAEACEKAKIRAALSTPLLDALGPEQSGRLISEGEVLVKRLGKNKRVKPFFGPHAPYTCSEELLVKARELADKYDAGLHIHVSETESEVKKSEQEKGKRPFEYLSSIGFLCSRVVAAHANWVSEKEIKIIKKAGSKIAHNTISNMKIASGIAPVESYLKNGIPVGLGTDGAASNNTLDMFETMKACALLHKISNLNPTVLPAQTVLELATMGSAKALGIENETGSIEKGKSADLITLDLKASNLTPLTNPVSHAVYAAKSSNVCDAIINGEIVMEDRELKTIDEEKVLENAKKQAYDLLKSANKLERFFN